MLQCQNVGQSWGDGSVIKVLEFEDLNLGLQHSRKQMGIYIPAHLQLKCCGYDMVWLGRRETNRFLGFIGQ